MAKDELIDDRVSLNHCKQAVDALFTHVSDVAAKKADTQLLPDTEQSFWLTVALKKQPQSSSLKVFTIPVAYPIVDPRKESVCLITKDPQRTYKDLIVDNDIHFIHKVVGIEKLKGKFKAYDARRALLKEHGLFLADKRIIPLLPKLLGSKFFDAKKQPLPVTVTRKDLKKELERAINSTYMPSIRGTALSIKVGRFSQPAAQVVANIKTALPAIAARVNGGWDNIQGLGLKTSNSVNLPIWSCSLDDTDGGRWAGLTVEDEEDEDESPGEEDEDEDESQGEDEDEELEQDESMDSDEADKDVDMDGDDEKSDSPAVMQTGKSKGKKRAADVDEDNQIVASPKRKKSKKSSDGSSLSAKDGTVDVPTTSKKSKPIVSTPAKTVAKESATSISPAKDVVSASKPRAKKGTALQAPTPTAANTPATTKKATAAVDKKSTKKKSAETTDAADAASVTTTIPNTSALKDAPKKDKKKEGKTSPTASGGLTKPAPTPIVAPIATTSTESMSAPANKSKKPLASKTAPVEPLVDVSVSTHGEPPSTQKKGNNVGVKAKKVESVATVVEEKDTSSSKKAKKEKRTTPAVEVSEKIPTVEVEVKDENPKKKRKEKKAKLSSDGALETEVTDVVVAVTENAKEGKEEKKKKGKKLIDPAAGPEDDAMVMDTAPAPDAVEKKPKKDKKSLVADEKEVPASLSKEELKKKKSDAPGEKKKNKVSKAKGGKSVKDSLLGKKVVQLGLLASSTPFITGRPVTLFHNQQILDSGAVGVAFTTPKSLHFDIPDDIQPLGDPLDVTGSEGNLINTLNFSNPTQLLLSRIRAAGIDTTSFTAIRFKDDMEFYLSVLPSLSPSVSAPYQLHAITAGDPSRGTLSLNTQSMAPPAGARVQFFHRRSVKPLSLDTWRDSASIRHGTVAFTTVSSPESLRDGGDEGKLESTGEELVLENQFVVGSENGSRVHRIYL
ncbi:u3 snornp-associated protein cic1 utp30 family protein [Lentinula edodes]|uniref:Ribosomal L1 domain-containing protein 1 n=1 Tax=Lentinula edodes TaxID=5353 RepID=A0A1Q3EPZ3_LENED|nr:u3 snornp-associated protein cic1 utp30 family protein [Lentinula edodes]